MPTYKVTDPNTGQTVKLTGDSPPTEAELEQVFASLAPQPVDFDLGTMVKNIPSSAVGIAKDMAHAVMNPIDTVSGIATLADQGVNKLALSAAEAVTGREAPNNLPGMETQAADAAIDFYADRYGSWDKTKQTVMDDPVGVALDASGLSFGAAKVPGLAKAANVGRVLDPAQVTAKGFKTAVAPMAHLVPDTTLEKWYQRSAKFSTAKTPEERQRLVQTALREKVIPTPNGVQKVNDRIDILNAQIDEIISEASKNKTMIPVDVVTQHLDTLRRTYGGFREGRGKDLAAIDKIYEEWMTDLDDLGQQIGGRVRAVTPEQMQNFKVEAYKKANYNIATGKREVKGDTRKAMARGAKDAIQERFPEVGEANRQLSDLYDLQPHLERASGRIANREPIGLMTPMNLTAGSLAGHALGNSVAGVTAAAVHTMLNSPKVRARIAVGVKKLQEGDIGWLDSNLSRQEAQVAVALAGQNEQRISDQ